MKKFILNSATIKDYAFLIESIIRKRITFNTFCTKEEYDTYEDEVGEPTPPQILVECEESSVSQFSGSYDWFEAE